MPRKRLLLLLVASILVGVLIINIEGMYNSVDNNPEKDELINSIFKDNDISSAKMTCYLHLKTTQVQLDINFLGADSTPKPNDNYVRSVNEEIAVFGTIRNKTFIKQK